MLPSPQDVPETPLPGYSHNDGHPSHRLQDHQTGSEERDRLIPSRDGENDDIGGPRSGMSMTHDGDCSQQSNTPFILILTFTAGIGGLLFGYE